MSIDDSVTKWFQQLPHHNRDHVQELWNRYFRRLVDLARAKMGNVPRRAADEEDIALSAFDSAIRAIENKRFPKLDDRADLWQILVMVTKRKVATQIERETRAKRDYRRNKKIDAPADSSSLGMEWNALVQHEPDPAFAACVAEQCQQLLNTLPNEKHREIALAKMEGYTNREIAGQHECSVATVERRLNTIRALWERGEL